jgi:hypothetical protein
VKELYHHKKSFFLSLYFIDSIQFFRANPLDASLPFPFLPERSLRTRAATFFATRETLLESYQKRGVRDLLVDCLLLLPNSLKFKFCNKSIRSTPPWAQEKQKHRKEQEQIPSPYSAYGPFFCSLRCTHFRRLLAPSIIIIEMPLSDIHSNDEDV